MVALGQKISAARRLAGLTQAQLASRTHYSLSYVRAVEQGREPASPAYIATVSRALRVDPDDLLGIPYRETLEKDGPLEGMTELRAILAEGVYVRPVEPSPPEKLAAEVERVNAVYRVDRGRDALTRLPGILRQIHGAVREARTEGERARAYSLLASGYVTTERLCRRFGYMSLCTPAVDRMEWAASHADDPLYVAQAKVKRARVLMYLDATDVSLKLVEQALSEIKGTGEAAVAVRGYSHLCGAIAAARARNLPVARAHLEEAALLAKKVRGVESSAYGTLFGPTNVSIHACAVEMEAGDPGKAAHDGTQLRIPRGIAPPRAGHHWQDTARAWLLAGKPAKALDALNCARRIAPQQTRLHPGVRETLRGIAESERRRSESLNSFAGWLGLRV
ncbi:helix-turn-helix domain-containing protein [Streptoalloteichus hindustanus]|uniref:Helix-turn-helix domain-containing protein n=1 Tax=Streptoalloteichus hindustanus TaxID=2017 RepID=A0A1M5GFE0_STRHI|nr:helix-turn-helix transcriptional regulator [Streptoalloteichus hindustanus]SHG02500.1 Helix-turn-helix domain-containing protein [Streptoalloteichus hindustanus]